MPPKKLLNSAPSGWKLAPSSWSRSRERLSWKSGGCRGRGGNRCGRDIWGWNDRYRRHTAGHWTARQVVHEGRILAHQPAEHGGQIQMVLARYTWGGCREMCHNGIIGLPHPKWVLKPNTRGMKSYRHASSTSR